MFLYFVIIRRKISTTHYNKNTKQQRRYIAFLVTHFVGRKTGSTCVGIYLNWENSITGSQITIEIVFWDGKVELLMTAHIYTCTRPV